MTMAAEPRPDEKITQYTDRSIGRSRTGGRRINSPSEGEMAMMKEQQKPKAEQDRQLSKELEMTFPASDPPASTEPGGGVTGTEAAPRRPAKAKGRPT
jgi:hypothetical protein